MSVLNRNVRADNVEFTVKAAENLVLSGKERQLIRVPVDNMYSCLMQKTQRFSSLFKHYSKHHGLPRESLEFFFTSRLDPEDSPETVHLQKNDVILVRHRAPSAICTAPPNSDESYFASMKQLLLSGNGSDVIFQVGPPPSTSIRAHRLILTTRSDIFAAMLRSTSCMRESEEGIIQIKDHAPEMVLKMLEFIYTNRVADLHKLNSNLLIDLISLSEQYLLEPLKHLVEMASRDILSISNIGRLLSAAEKYNANFLKEICLRFFLDHVNEIIEDEHFKEEVEENPLLALTILRATASEILPTPNPICKRRRLNMPLSDEYEDV